jgi:CPA1 family monovalent cation:H+ antiporter
MADPRVAALAQVPLFAGLSPRELATIASSAEELTASPGQVLTREGDDGDEFYVIASGSVCITSAGRELRRLGPGDYLGEIALVFGGNRTATATVEEPARLFVVGKDTFTTMLQEHPGIEDKILSTVSERMRYR